MATLAQQRRAIANGMAADRRPTAAAERQAIAQRLPAERRGADMVDDLNRLTPPPRAPRRTLRQLEPVGAVPASQGRGVYRAPPATGAGVAGPFTEQSYAAREWWPGGIPSSDGLLMLPAEKAITMTDGTGAVVVFNYAEPA